MAGLGEAESGHCLGQGMRIQVGRQCVEFVLSDGVVDPGQEAGSACAANVVR